MKSNGLLKRPVREATSHQCTKLFELLHTRPEELWRSDVNWIHVPSFSWRYAVTVQDHYSRYLLAYHLISIRSTNDAIAVFEPTLRDEKRSGDDRLAPANVYPNMRTVMNSNWKSRGASRRKKLLGMTGELRNPDWLDNQKNFLI